MAKPILTLKEIQDVNRALNVVWNAIGSDILASVGGEMSRDDVIEVVLDCSYIEMYGNLDKETFNKFNALSHISKVKLAESAFQYDWYGY